MIVKFIATNGYKASFEDLNKDDTIDKLKLRIYREFSQHLPIPSNIFLDSGDKDKNNNTDDDDNREDSMQVDNGFKPSIIHPFQIRLLFGGKQLNNFSTLEENKITSEDTLIIAISPFYSLRKNDQDEHAMKVDGDSPNSKTTDELIVSSKDGINNFTLAVNDHSAFEIQKFSILESLPEKDANLLFTRLKSDNDNKNNNNNNNNNNNDNKYAKLVQSDTKFKILKDTESLETIMDRLSIESKPDINKVEIFQPPLQIVTFTPTGSIDTAYKVSVVFNRSFIPLTNDLSQCPIPFSITPEVPNAKWQWVDGITCNYTTPNNKPFPRSTKYIVNTLPEVFKNNYNETFEMKSWEIITSVQYLNYPYFNNNQENPQVLLRFSQNLPKEFFERKRFNEFFEITRTIDNIMFDETELVLFEVLRDPKDIDEKILSQFDRSSDRDIKNNEVCNKIPDDSIIFKLKLLDLEQIPDDTSFDINVLTGIPSAEGPLKTSTILTGTFQSPPSLTITPNTKYPDTYATSASFTSTAYLKTFVFKDLTEEEISNYVDIKPPAKINNINCSTTINIFASFDFNRSYTITVKNFVDSNGQKIKPTTGVFSFGSEPIEFKLTTDYADPYLFNLDPLSKPIIKVLSKGLTSVQFNAYKPKSEFQNKFFSIQKEKINDIAKEIGSGKIPINYKIRESSDTSVDLSKYFGSESSDKVVNPLLYFTFTYGKNVVGKWVQYSPYTPSVVSYGNDISLWIFNAITNEKVNDFKVDLYTNTSFGSLDTVNSHQSGDNGLVIVNAPKTYFQGIVFKPTKGNMVNTVFKFNYSPTSDTKKVEWETVDECGYYKPGDTVNIKGIVRFRDPNTSEISYPDLNGSISFKVRDPRGIEKTTGQTNLDRHGCFTIKFTLPLDTNLGAITVNLTGPLDSQCSHVFQLQMFKLKQFIVESKAEQSQSSPHIRENDRFSVQASAKSYTGEVLSNTQVDWSVSLSSTKPKTLPSGYDFIFPENPEYAGPYKFSSKRIISGRHKMDFVLQDLKTSYVVNVSGIIKDVTNVSESFSHHFTVYSKELFFGILRGSHQNYVNIDEELKYSFLVSDSLGTLSNKGNIKVQIKKVPWEEDLPLQIVEDRDIVPSSEAPVDFKYKFNGTGYYKIFLSYKESDSSPEQLFKKELFVLGTQSDSEKEYKELKPPINNSFKTFPTLYAGKPSLDLKILIKDQKDTYSPFDVLNLVITSSKIQKGSGFLFICNNLRQSEQIPINLVDGTATYTYSIKPNDFPMVTFKTYIQGSVSMVINSQQVNRLSSQFASVSTKLSLEGKKLSVEVVGLKKFQTPGETSKFTILVKNKKTEKVAGDAFVTLAIVDESLIDISKKSVSDWDPLQNFFKQTVGPSASYSLLDSTIFQDPLKQDTLMEVVVPIENQITVKYFTGRFIIFKVSNEISITKLRKLIEEKDGLPPSMQRLFYQNKQITETDEQKTLKEFGVPNGAQLNIVIRLSGGSGTGPDDKPDPVVPQKVIRLRENFNSVAYFGSKTTSVNGLVDFECKLPDNLTSYKIMAYASTLSEFGSNENTFTSTLPVMVRPTPPRFLNYNDECTFPISVQSTVNYNLQVNIAIDSTTCKLQQTGFKGKLGPFGRLTIPAKVRALVPGVTTQFRCVVQTLTDSGEELTDALNFKFPIASPTSIESMSINDQLVDSGKEYSCHPVNFANIGNIDQQVGGLKLNLSMSPLTRVRSCVDSLLRYEHACSEQISSKLLPYAIIINNTHLFDKSTADQVNEQCDETTKMIEKLTNRYNSSTHTFRYWDAADSKSYDYVNLYVYWVLDNVSKIAPSYSPKLKFATEGSTNYINDLLSSFSMSTYKKEKKLYLERMAFACFISKNTTKATETAKKILQIAKSDYPKDYLDILVYIIRYFKDTKEIDYIMNNITITGTMAHINGSNIDGFQSVSRNNAIAILSLLEILPTHKLIPKLVSGLSKGYNQNYNTQDNAFALYAMYKYSNFLSGKSSMSNFYVHLNQFQLDGKKELTFDKQEISMELPMSVLLKNQGNLFIEKLAKSNLFFNITLEYGMKNTFYKEVNDRGFSIKRTYLPLQNASDVIYSDQQIDGNSVVKIKAGTKVKVLLELTVRDVSTFVVIRDFLPSGLEPTLQNRKSYWMNHINIRDKGCEAFGDYMYPGNYSFSYITDALTFGTYIAPPAKIEEMYCATTFGRSQSQIIVIE